jgi:hypothetical protein
MVSLKTKIIGGAVIALVIVFCIAIAVHEHVKRVQADERLEAIEKIADTRVHDIQAEMDERVAELETRLKEIENQKAQVPKMSAAELRALLASMVPGVSPTPPHRESPDVVNRPEPETKDGASQANLPEAPSASHPLPAPQAWSYFSEDEVRAIDNRLLDCAKDQAKLGVCEKNLAAAIEQRDVRTDEVGDVKKIKTGGFWGALMHAGKVAICSGAGATPGAIANNKNAAIVGAAVAGGVCAAWR